MAMIGPKLKSWARRVKWRAKRFLQPPSAANFSELDLIHRLLTRGSRRGVMIDVGAQFGESFGPFAWAGWQVIAFEPDPDPRKQEVLASMGGGRVSIRRLAVADRAKPAVAFYTSEESTGISSLSAFRSTHQETAKVAVSTLAEEIDVDRVSRVDFLKIDTEGHDLFVLRGFPWAEAKLKPAVILCEFEDSKTKALGYDWRDMADFLVAQGYSILVSEWYPIERYGVRHRWRSIERYPCQLCEQRGWGNLIAFADAALLQDFEKVSQPYHRP